MQLNPSTPAFYQQLAEQMLAKADMVASWGVTHPPTLGANRENTVRHLLQDVLPSTLRFGTGFVVNDAMQISHQCDIIIYDDSVVPPLYRDEDIVILRHIAVAMVIEVKTTLSKSKLNDALFNIASAKPSRHTSQVAFSAFWVPRKRLLRLRTGLNNSKAKEFKLLVKSSATCSRPKHGQITFMPCAGEGRNEDTDLWLNWIRMMFRHGLFCEIAVDWVNSSGFIGMFFKIR